MNKAFIIFLLVFISLSVSAQQFSQYNTGTLYDSFENPSQRSFIPDSSRGVASNFFIPNFNADFYLTGNAQAPLKSRAFTKNGYGPRSLLIDQGSLNHFNANFNGYAFMLKLFTSLNGNVEIGFSAQVKIESKGIITDESVALLNGAGDFPADHYDNIFNDHYRYQSYDQLSFSYREQISKKFAMGFKLSALSGIQYQKIDITGSHIDFNRPEDAAYISLQGQYYRSYVPGRLTSGDFLPTFRNPGAAISVGTSYKTENGIIIQGNIKDLGFIQWSSRSTIHNFDGTATINGLSQPKRDDSVYNTVDKVLLSGNGPVKSFTTKINAKAELRFSKSYWINDSKTLRYFPTLIASKEVWDTGFTGAWVNSIQNGNFIASLTASYDDYNLFNIGAQVMYKSPNAEVFIGSDRFTNTGKLALAAFGSSGQVNNNSDGYSGGNIYFGISFKIGRVIEHPMNSSYIPMGEKGFFGRLFGRIFKTYN